MQKSVSLITHTREDLLYVTKVLVGNINSACFQDPENPVIFLVDGDLASGKKIIPDTSKEFLLGPNAVGEGYFDCDEYWAGYFNGHLTDIRFVNADLGGRHYSNPALHDRRLQEIVAAFLGLPRKYGGLSFIHNSGMQNFPNIQLTISQFRKGIPDENLQARFFEVFANSQDPEWLRAITIDVMDPRLAECSQFHEALQVLSRNYPVCKSSKFVREIGCGLR